MDVIRGEIESKTYKKTYKKSNTNAILMQKLMQIRSNETLDAKPRATIISKFQCPDRLTVSRVLSVVGFITSAAFFSSYVRAGRMRPE